jgi:hypothetical protein
LTHLRKKTNIELLELELEMKFYEEQKYRPQRSELKLPPLGEFRLNS